MHDALCADKANDGELVVRLLTPAPSRLGAGRSQVQILSPRLEKALLLQGFFVGTGGRRLVDAAIS